MKKQYVLAFITFMLLTIAISGIVSANILVAGKIYNSDYSHTISGASITVTCDSQTPLSTTTLADGTFGVVFGVDLCTNVGVIEDSGIYKVTDIKQSIPSDTSQTTTTTTQSTGHSKIIYQCGNGKCDSGETYQTCLKDCPIITNENNTELINNTLENTNAELNSAETQNTETPSNNTPITGAVTGTSGNGLIVVLILVLVFIFGLIAIFLVRRRNKNKEF